MTSSRSAAAARAVKKKPEPGRIVLAIKNLIKIREKGGVVFELRVPDLVIRAGEFLAVIGPSGCGKSTLLDFMGLVLKPSSYQTYTLIAQNGKMNLGKLAEPKIAVLRQSELGYVLQSGGLLPYLSVRDNILLPARLNGLPAQHMERRLEELVDRLNIADQLPKKPSHLSGGQRQRVAIARALIHEPRLVLADEPTAAVDFPTAMEICSIFRDLTSKQGQALVMVTHDQKLVRHLADRFISFKFKKINENHTVSTAAEVRFGG